MRDEHTEEERRSLERFPCKDVRMSYWQEGGFLAGFLGGKKQESKPLPVRDMSRHGLCFLSRKELKLDRELRMTIRLGHRKPTVRAGGRVLWCGLGEGIYPYKIGVGFTQVSPRSWAILKRLPDYFPHEEAWTRWRFRSKERASRPFGMSDSFRESRQD